MKYSFRPKLLETLKGYSRGDFLRDLSAGITVGVVALPLALAFGISSVADPRAGLYTAVVAGFLISLLGGTRVCVGGPTGAFIGIVYGVYTQYGMANLTICTLLAGIMLIGMGWAKLGGLIKYIPYPVTGGFTAGIAVIILSSQFRDLLGIPLAEGQKVPPEFVHKLIFLGKNAGSIHGLSVLLAAVSMALIFAWPARWQRYVPGSIAAMVLGTVAVVAGGLDTRFGVMTVGSVFGEIPQSLPPLTLPQVDWMKLPELFRPAFTIAMLAAIESLLCAVVADGMIDDRHDSNQELVAQGIANVGSALMGGIPATGAIARTATNVRNGARTPVAGLIHAVVLLLIILLAAPLAKDIPLATLGAVLVNVSLRMGEWHNFRRLTKWPLGDAAVFLLTFALTVLFDLTFAVEVGLLMAAAMFIHRIASTTQLIAADTRETSDSAQNRVEGKVVPEGVVTFRMVGAFLFGAADKLETALKRLKERPRVLILRMQDVLAIDATGLNALEEIEEKWRSYGTRLVVSGAHTQPLMAMSQAGLVEKWGAENFCENFDAALEHARALLAKPAVNP
ncbi:MAG: STAS domain-containing protein [Verrucomicrobiales bacterium]|nr:STAS domain-containing protein [Verrucomicrobiales bacterium]